jgi:small subunit ribosomal protein S17
MAHDESNSCAIGDQVQIVEHRPVSKRKRWKVQATLAKA